MLLLVVNATQVRRILLGNEGLARHLKPAPPSWSSSTIAAEEASALAAELAQMGLLMLDALSFRWCHWPMPAR